MGLMCPPVVSIFRFPTGSGPNKFQKPQKRNLILDFKFKIFGVLSIKIPLGFNILKISHNVER